MIARNFDINVLSNYRAFFLLDEHFDNEVIFTVQTPNGEEVVDFVHVFRMANNRLVAAWEHPFQKLGIQNVVATHGQHKQIVNLYPVERVVDIIEKPSTSTSGTFTFVDSRPIANADWRCDRGYYGARQFTYTGKSVVGEVGDVVAFESILSVAGVGHIIYLEFADEPNISDYHLNEFPAPVTGRSLAEVLRLVYEWSVVALPPFDCKDRVAESARSFVDMLNFTETEMGVLESLPGMQISAYIAGSVDARRRPDVLPEFSMDVVKIVFDRMASSSLSFIASSNPDIWDMNELIEAEKRELVEGIQRFKKFYGIPGDCGLNEVSRAVSFADLYVPGNSAFVHNQLRFFRNKEALLFGVLSGLEK